jgi:hypothetical protein
MLEWPNVADGLQREVLKALLLPAWYLGKNTIENPFQETFIKAFLLVL